WDLNRIQHAGARGAPVEVGLRCGPSGARDTIVNGEFVVRKGELVSDLREDVLHRHRLEARRIQGSVS
ncbi:MAG: 8-oxoguanine deaminase, partial [Ilumatobacteraceae bacterium]